MAGWIPEHRPNQYPVKILVDEMEVEKETYDDFIDDSTIFECTVMLLSCYLGVLFYIVATHRGRPPQFVIDHCQIILNRSQLEQNISCIFFRFYSSIYNSAKDLLAHSFP